jgi:uncharacterized protein (UPF0332 family)/predicted nucleotidyltransferase
MSQKKKTTSSQKKPLSQPPPAPKLTAQQKKRLELAKKFKQEVLKKYQKLVKAIIIFGSVSRGDVHTKSDVDMLVIIDDTLGPISPEMKQKIDFELLDLGKAINKDIVVQPTWTLTEFWDMARIGHPLLYTIVRDGWALYDTGFFIPVRKLLEMGRIPTTLEAVERFMESVPKKIQRVESAKLFMIAEDLYYAMLNSSQAVLMFLGINPPPPKFTPDAIKEHLVDEDMLEKEYLEMIQDVIDFRKGVEHKEIKDIKGEELDEFIKKTKKFVERMEQLLASLEKKRKATTIEKNYEVLVKASVAALKNLDVLPPDPKRLPQAIKKHLIDSGKLRGNYTSTFKMIIDMKKALDSGKYDSISQKDVDLSREYVRRFIRDLGPLMTPKPPSAPTPDEITKSKPKKKK